MEDRAYYTAKEVLKILNITHSALRNKVNTKQIRSFTPPGKRQSVYVKEDVDRLRHAEEGEFYSAKEAQGILGMTYSALRNQVEAKNIRSFIPKGKHQAVYVKEDVDQLARELKIFMATKKRNPTTFMKATTREEVFETTKLSDAIFGGHIDVDRQMRWLQKNPDLIYIAKNEGKVVGYAIILPLSHKKIEKLLREEEYVIDAEPEEIEEFKRGETIHLYMGAIGVIPGVTIAEKRAYGAKLVSGLMRVIINLGRQGVIIKTITARSTKPDGIRLLRELGFTELLSTTEKKNFMVDVEKSGIKEIMQYKQALRESGVFSFPEELSELPEILPREQGRAVP
jgi:hypothetical protein